MARCGCGYNHAGQLVNRCSKHARTVVKKTTPVILKKKGAKK